MPESITSSWSRIRHWLEANSSDITTRFQAAATDDDIRSLEDAVGMALPADLKDWLRIHNGGEDTGVFPSSNRFDMMAFSPMTTQEIIETWAMLKGLINSGEFGDRKSEADDGICTDWWNSSWIPFATNGGGDFQCVDLAPTNSGTNGQIISAWHADNERQLIASSLAEYLQMLADGLENGKYDYDEEEGIVPADE